MTQWDVLEFIEKEDRVLTAREISKALNQNFLCINRQLSRLRSNDMVVYYWNKGHMLYWRKKEDKDGL